MEVNFCHEDIASDGLKPEQRERFTTQMQKVVVLIYDRDDERLVAGHGVLINPTGLILTAFHLFEHKKIGSSVTVGWNNGLHTHKFIAKIRRLEKESDIALLQVTADTNRNRISFDFNYATFAEECVLGQDVNMIFSNDGINFEYVNGTIDHAMRSITNIPPHQTTHIAYLGQDTPLLQAHNLHGTPGFSGGPAFNSKGQILGVYSFGYMRMDFLIHLLKVKEIVSSQRN